MSRRIRAKGPKKFHDIATSTPADSQLPRHLLDAQEQERKRISRELHDETGQGLMLLRLQLGMLSAEVKDQEVRVKVEETVDLLDRTIGGLRRIISRLSPRALEELGLVAAIRRETRELGKNTGIKGDLRAPPDLGILDHDVEVAAYRCVQEALHNVAKHSHARNLSVRLQTGNHKLTLLIEDDGVGIANKARAQSRGFGLLGMKERVAALGGALRIMSPGSRGTRLRIVFPISKGKPSRKDRSSSVTVLRRAAISRAS